MNILILFAHPAWEKSRVHRALIQSAQGIQGVTIHDLYEWYPDFNIDVRREQDLLLQHDIVIWQHPIYWYSAPAILKQWMDLVLEHGWAYGHEGHQLDGKPVLNVVSTGGRQQAYGPGGTNLYTIQEFLRPFERTAGLCRMDYWAPFVVHGTHRLNDEDIQKYANQYQELLVDIRNDHLTLEKRKGKNYLNQCVPMQEPVNPD